MKLEHKDFVLPEVDLSHDEGDPDWHAAGGKGSSPVLREDGSIRHYCWNGLPPGSYAEYYRLCVLEDWQEISEAYEADPDDVLAAWYYLDRHPAFWKFSKNRINREEYPANHVCFLEHEGAMRSGWPDITPHKVNPLTRSIEEDHSLNTELEWWYEFGPSSLEDGHSWHDYKLDGGASSYEECAIRIARKVWYYYGNDRRVIDSEEWRGKDIYDGTEYLEEE